MPAKENGSEFQRVRSQAVRVASRCGASYGHLMAVQKALRAAGYSLRQRWRDRPVAKGHSDEVLDRRSNDQTVPVLP